MSGRFNKAEFAALCETKDTKINSHLNNELKKKYGLSYRTNKSGKVEFEFDPDRPGTDGNGFEIQRRYLSLTSAPRMSPEEKQQIIRKTRIR
jgi:hypothetical protein